MPRHGVGIVEGIFGHAIEAVLIAMDRMTERPDRIDDGWSIGGCLPRRSTCTFPCCFALLPRPPTRHSLSSWPASPSPP